MLYIPYYDKVLRRVTDKKYKKGVYLFVCLQYNEHNIFESAISRKDVSFFERHRLYSLNSPPHTFYRNRRSRYVPAR